MKMSAQDHGQVSVLTVSGEFDADDIDAFGKVVEAKAERGAKHLLIDCEHLEFIDSAALEALLDVQERLGRDGGQLRLIRPDDTVRTILRLTELEAALEAHPTLEAAVRSLR